MFLNKSSFFLFLGISLFIQPFSKIDDANLFKDDKYTFITNGAWNNPENWEDQEMPGADSKVILYANPIVYGHKVIESLEVSKGVVLDITDFAVLIVTGQIHNEGSITGGGDLLLNGNSAQFITGEGSFRNLRIDNPSTVHINDSLAIYGILFVDKGNLLTKNNLSLKCSFLDQSVAQVAPIKGKITGKVTVEQCYPARRANRLISPSVTTSTSIRHNWQEDANSYRDHSIPEGHGTHITGLNPGSGPAHLDEDGRDGFDFNPSGNASMFLYNNQVSEFSPIDNTDVNTLVSGDAYRLLIRGDRSINIYSNSAQPTQTKLRSKGQLHTGDYSTTDLSPETDGFSLIGNPYHAQVDMISVLANSINLREYVYYVWDPTLGGVQDLEQSGGRGAFVVVDLLSGTNSSNSEANRYLQPMQAVFVQTSDEGIDPSLNFSEEDKAVENNSTEILKVSEDQFINIQLYNQSSYDLESTPSDALRINFGESYTNQINDDFPKLKNTDENLTRLIDGQLIALERRSVSVLEDVLPLCLNQYRRQNYVFKFEITEDLLQHIYIIDSYLETETLISNSSDTYPFNVNSSVPGSIDEYRFSLKLMPQSLSVTSDEFSKVKLYPNPTQENFSISGLGNGSETEVEIYTMLGQKIYQRPLGKTSIQEISDFNAAPGTYLVKLKSDAAEYTLKLVKQ
jgi:hypothetical protein